MSATERTEARYNYRQNKQKSLQDLLGILQGIKADSLINFDETLFLDTWLRENRILSSDPDSVDLLELTTDILSDGIATVDELDDLLGLVTDISNFRADPEFSNDKEAMQRLLGICKGIGADRRINHLEAAALNQWLQQSEIWTSNPVADHIRDVLFQILDQGLISKEEEAELVGLLQDISGHNFDDGVTTGLSIQLFGSDCGEISIPDRNFCFTGSFLYGSRKKCHEITRDLGGIIHKTILKNTDYLVIGDLSSRDWAHTSFGRKIEKAITYRDSGHPISILPEAAWTSVLT